MVAEPFSVAFLALALNPRRNDHNRPAKERTAQPQELVDCIFRAPRIPVGPNFRTFNADRRAQQGEAMFAQGLSLLDPADTKAFQGFDRFSGVVLHALED